MHNVKGLDDMGLDMSSGTVLRTFLILCSIFKNVVAREYSEYKKI